MGFDAHSDITARALINLAAALVARPFYEGVVKLTRPRVDRALLTTVAFLDTSAD